MKSVAVRIFAAALLVVAAAAPSVNAQRTEPEFLWLSPSALGTGKSVLKKLQDAADHGYRLVPLPPSDSLLLVHKPAEPSEPVEYAFVSSAKETEEKAAIGFRLVSSGVMVRTKGATTRTHEYAHVATRLRQSMESELRVAATDGFRVVSLGLVPVLGVSSFVNGVDNTEFVAILERRLNATPSTRAEYIVLSSLKSSTMQRELQAAADRGYRLPSFQGAWGATVLLEKADDADRLEYLVLSTAKIATMEGEMSKAAAEGYRFALALNSGAREFAIVMQRAKGSRVRTHEQVVRAANRIGTLKRETMTDIEKGFLPVGFTSVSGFVHNPEEVMVLERAVR